MRTSPVVSFGLYALEIKPDSIPSCPDLQPFAKIADLINDNAASLPYASYEPNFWLLDGGYKFLPTNQASVHVGLMSLGMSDETGSFAIPPALTVNFTIPHTSDGLTLKFSQYTSDWASLVTVTYYDATATLIRSDAYEPDTWELITGVAVNDFKQIVITFYGTNKPYRHLRLSTIDYGKLIYFTGSQIKAASVVEEIDPMSGEARFNTLDLRLYSADAQFSLINPSGYYQYLQDRQPVVVHEEVDNQSVYIGQFYLDTWENKSDKQIEFHCIDLLGILGTITYYGGLWTGSNLADVIESILGTIHIPYDLEASLYGVQVKGWLPICSYREALQQIGLACGAYVDCSRSGSIKIYPAPIAATATPSTTITRSQKGQSQSLGLKPLITGVEVTSHDYVTLTTVETLYSATMTAGTYTVTWNQPHHTLTISGATIVTSGVNWATISVSSPGAVLLQGRMYQDITRVISITTPGFPSTTHPNILKVENATLVNSSNALAVCQRLSDYNQQRYLQKLRMYAPMNVQIGNVVAVEALYNQRIRALVEKMSIDLFGGMVADVELVGVVDD